MKKISNFEKLVYETTKKIPRGRVTSYKELAGAISSPKSYRAVGNALNKNLFAPSVPCHRVVCADASLGGFAFGQSKKKRLLEEEGLKISKNKVQDFSSKMYYF